MSSQQQDAHIGLVYELISAYFAGLTYDNLYGIAKANVAAEGSITDEFITRVDLFISSMKEDATEFRKIVSSLHIYFRTSPKYASTNFIEFVDRIIHIYAPDEEYFTALSASDKDQILSTVLCDAASGLSTFITQPDMVKRIIDNHDAGRIVTMRMLQNNVVQSLTTKRIEIRNKFLKKKSQSRDVVPKSVLDSMQKKINTLTEQNEELESELDDVTERAARYKRALRVAKTTESQLRELIDLLAKGGGMSQPADVMRAPLPNTLGEVHVSPFPVIHPHNTLGELVEVPEYSPQLEVDPVPSPRTAELIETSHQLSIQSHRGPLHPEYVSPDNPDEVGHDQHESASAQVSSNEENLFQGVPAPSTPQRNKYEYDDEGY